MSDTYYLTEFFYGNCVQVSPPKIQKGLIVVRQIFMWGNGICAPSFGVMSDPTIEPLSFPILVVIAMAYGLFAFHFTVFTVYCVCWCLTPSRLFP